MELLAIVQAEAEADRVLAVAQEQRAAAIKQAQRERVARLASIKPEAPHEPHLRALNANLEHIKTTALRNKARAVKQILGDIYAA